MDSADVQNQNSSKPNLYGRNRFHLRVQDCNINSMTTTASRFKSKNSAFGCSVPGCSTGKDEVVYHFPPKARNQEQFKLWQKELQVALGSHWTPSSKSRVCTKHFLSGAPSELRIDPDYVPSVFRWNDRKRPTNKREVEKFKQVQKLIEERTKAIIENKRKPPEERVTLPPLDYGIYAPTFTIPVSDDEPKRKVIDTGTPFKKAEKKKFKVEQQSPRSTCRIQKHLPSNVYDTLNTLRDKLKTAENELALLRRANKTMTERLYENYKAMPENKTFVFRGTQTREEDHGNHAAEFSDDEATELTHSRWLNRVKTSNVNDPWRFKPRKKIQIQSKRPQAAAKTRPKLTPLTKVDVAQVPEAIRLAVEHSLRAQNRLYT